MTDGRRGKDVAAVWAPLSEKDFLAQVVQLAEIRGWQWLHLRPGMTRDSWRTPISGPLGKGWPDLVLVHERQRRLVFTELKAEGGKLTADQERVLQTLHGLESFLIVGDPAQAAFARISVYVWHPSNWPEIERVLR